MNKEYKKAYGICNKYNKEANIEIEYFVDESCEGNDYVKNRIAHCPLDPHRQCRREQCHIWLKTDFNFGR